MNSHMQDLNGTYVIPPARYSIKFSSKLSFISVRRLIFVKQIFESGDMRSPCV
jgi:hypothetical protein